MQVDVFEVVSLSYKPTLLNEDKQDLSIGRGYRRHRPLGGGYYGRGPFFDSWLDDDVEIILERALVSHVQYPFAGLWDRIKRYVLALVLYKY